MLIIIFPHTLHIYDLSNILQSLSVQNIVAKYQKIYYISDAYFIFIHTKNS